LYAAGGAVAAAGVAAAWTAVALTQPAAAIVLPLVAVAIVALLRVEPRYLAAGAIVVLPLQDVLMAHLAGPPLLIVRYAPEMLLTVLAVLLLVTHWRRIVTRLGPVATALALALSFWALTGLANAVSLDTMLVGFRSEFRFLPLAFLPLLSKEPFRDARLYARILVLLGAAEAALAVVQFVGGEGVRAAFAPTYTIRAGDVTVGEGLPSLDHPFGTFAHRNLLGVYLALTWVVLAAAGARGLGWPRRAVRVVGTLLVVGAVVSASRSGAIALVVGAAVVAVVRVRRDIVKLAALGFALLVLAGLWSAPTGPAAINALDATSLLSRWSVLFTPVAWSPDSSFRVRLALENSKLVVHERPMFGFGIGTASDPRLVSRLTSPVYRSFPGLERAVQPFVSDGNWAVLILEVGFVGVALLALLFLVLLRLGASVDHWSGLALMAVVTAIVVLGFFSPVLQERAPSATLWLLVGVAAAAAGSVPRAGRAAAGKEVGAS